MITKEEYGARPMSIDFVFKTLAEAGVNQIDMTVGMLRPTTANKPETISDDATPSLVLTGNLHFETPSLEIKMPWWVKGLCGFEADEDSVPDGKVFRFTIWLNDLPEVLCQIQEEGYESLVDRQDDWRSVKSRFQYEVDKETEKIKTNFLPELTEAKMRFEAGKEIFIANMQKRTTMKVNVKFWS
jgi:hypothetical protein